MELVVVLWLKPPRYWIDLNLTSGEEDVYGYRLAAGRRLVTKPKCSVRVMLDAGF
jgi:hypothetical protein